ncbi:MAG TPA: permease [Arenicellales bacterium]|nr:permease [Arenicellales bacterium]
MNTSSTQAKAPVTVRFLLSGLFADRVLVSVVVGLGLVALLDPAQALLSLRFTLQSLLGILPFLLIAVTLAALTRASGADRLIARAFAGHPARAVLIAGLAGALSPFCSCGVIPIIAALLRAGVPLAPVMAFWIASPIMDPEMFVLTAAGIGPEFAVAKTVATIMMGLLAGYSILLISQRAAFASPLRDNGGSRSCTAPLPQGPIAWQFWKASERRQLFRAEFASNCLFLGKWLLLAFFLESLMVTWVPAELVSRVLGSGAWYEIPLAAVLGVPTYLNGYAAIPLISGLLEMGMNPGAAMAFMNAGGVSSIPAAMAVAVLVKRPVFAAYVALGLAGSMVTAVLYGLLA